ncbi:MAG: hypothetical protein KJO77_09770 [Bacteroidia bacterium]|nr:hypothetical protein [Bacteroidia bacterium]
MAPSKMNKKLCCLIFFLTTTIFFAQEQVEFTKNVQFYIRGDATVIGNNIVSKYQSKPFSDFGLINDQVKMKYVDVDNNPSTFSSSSASLNIPDRNAKIVSATLYWSGVYPYDTGVKRQRPTEIYYEGNNSRNNAINRIKFKGPTGNYKDVTGQVIFDGYGKDEYKDSAPYVCYADVTQELNNSSALKGEFTVANIRATQGFVSGGSAAGWFLFVVYEAPRKPLKYITSYHGFSSLNDNFITIEFSDFKTREAGEIRASIFAAALEGDSKLSRDESSIYNSKEETFTLLKNALRAPKNFFNSKITINNKYFSNRNPNSANTLGFDLLQMQVPSNLISNSQTETTIRLGTRADRFYLFFTAFTTELNPNYLKRNEVVEIKSEDASTLIEDIPAIKIDKPPTPKKDVVKTTPKAAPKKPSSKPVNKPAKKPIVLSVKAMEKELNKVDLNVPDVKKGYYLITNVFSEAENSKRWEDFLKSKGYKPKTFVNPKNNWIYVYVYNNEDLKKVYSTYKRLVRLNFFNEIWVYKINLN